VFTSATGTRLNVRNVEEDFKRLLVKAGLPSHHTPHSARHTFATLLLRAGVPLECVKRRLGHASIGLTADTYGKWLPDSDEPAWTPRPGQFWVDVLDTPTANGSNLVATAANCSE
jgi:integrase